MQSAEEFAESALGDERVSMWEHDASEIAALADLIRARDAEVAARAWDKGYGAGVHDERTAAEYNAGSPFAGVSPTRVNPYKREAGESDGDA